MKAATASEPSSGVPLAGWRQSANSRVFSRPQAPVVNPSPSVTQSRVRQENENCYCSGSLYLNQRRANF